jgi:predicted  nucleic acid-binding Zn-ribbon protein
MDSIQIIQALKELQSIARANKSARPTALTALSPRQVALRSEIPNSILSHFDRLLSQGRSGVAPLRNGVCGGCHIRIPRAHIAGIRASHELDVCDQCGTFIYSEEILAAAAEHTLATAEV